MFAKISFWCFILIAVYSCYIFPACFVVVIRKKDCTIFLPTQFTHLYIHFYFYIFTFSYFFSYFILPYERQRLLKVKEVRKRRRIGKEGVSGPRGEGGREGGEEFSHWGL